jgi:hypothetical protein
MAKKTGKKAEISTSTIITVIILVVSFVIILFLWYQINWKGEITKETCHTSVILRAAASVKKIEFRDSIPFECKAEKICFVSGSSSKGCESLGKTYQRVTVKSRDEILDALAENVYSWHTTLGEGKVNYMEAGFLANKYCSINSVLSFDNDTRNIVTASGGINYLDVFKRLETKTTSAGTSYLKEMYKEDRALNMQAKDQKDIQYTNSQMDVNRDQAVLSAIVPDAKWPALTAAAGAAAAVVGIALCPFTACSSLSLTGVGVTIIIGGVTSTITYYSVKPDPDAKYRYIPPQIMPYDASVLKVFECSSFESLS